MIALLCELPECTRYFWTRKPDRKRCAKHGGFQRGARRVPRYKAVHHPKVAVVAQPAKQKGKKKQKK